MFPNLCLILISALLCTTVFVSVVTHCWTVFSGTSDSWCSLLTENSQLVFRSQHCNEERATGFTHINSWTRLDVHSCQESRLNAVTKAGSCAVLLHVMYCCCKKNCMFHFASPSVGFFCIILHALLPPSVTQRNCTQFVLSCDLYSVTCHPVLKKEK